MRRVPCRPDQPDAAVLAEALAVLAQGGVVVAPTDTVYGLLAHPDYPEAAQRIYALKSRPLDKPLPYLIDSLSRLADFGIVPTPAQATYLAQRWPGATTALLARPDGAKVGFRLPDCPLITQLIALVGHPLVSTSANPSGAPDTHHSARLDPALLERVDLLLDARRYGSGRASTVVDLTTDPFIVLR